MDSPQARDELQRFLGCRVAKGGTLRQVADLRPGGDGVTQAVMPVNAGAPSVGDQPQEAPQHAGFARTVRPNEGDCFTWVQVKGDCVEDSPLP